MVGEGVQNYVDMAAGLTKATRAKAQAAAKTLLASAGLEDVAADASDRVGRLTEEILAASRANRELMAKLVAAEVDKAAAKLGFVRADELDQLRRELSEVRMSMAHAAAHQDEPPLSPEPLHEPDDAPVIQPITEPIAQPGDPLRTTAKTTAAKRAAAKKAAAKKAAIPTPAHKAAAKKSATRKAAATKSAAKKAPSEKAAVTAPAKSATQTHE